MTMSTDRKTEEDHAAAVRDFGRVAKRRDLECDVTLESEHNFYTGFTENISSGGLFISTRDNVPLGTQFEMTFTLPNVGAVTVLCEVRWQRLEDLNNAESVPGLGVRFLNLDDKTSEAINAFIQGRDTLFYDDE